MGQTTTVILMMGQEPDEQRRLDQVNAWLARGHPFGDSPVGRLEWVHREGGGNRASNVDVAMGSFRNLPSPLRLVDFLVTRVPWDNPDAVLVVIRDENDEAPTAIHFGRPKTIAVDVGGEPMPVAIARAVWGSHDWEWWHAEDGSDRRHTAEEWARYHYGKDWARYVDDFRPSLDDTERTP